MRKHVDAVKIPVLQGGEDVNTGIWELTDCDV